MRVDELVDQARLAHPRLADERRHLTVTVTRELLGAAKLFQLGVAADEAREAAPVAACRRVSAGPAPVTSKTSTASARPFTGKGPSGLTST